MPYFVYIIYSILLDRYYIGYTQDIVKRLEEHNSGISTYTSKASDWELKYARGFETRLLAMKREREIKKQKSRKCIEQLIMKK